MICLTDYKIVCTDCIIFGIHKNHQYSKVEDFQKEVKIKASTLENKIETFKYRHFLNDNEEQIEVLREKVKGKKEKLKSRIKENVESLIEEIKQKQKGLEEKLEMKFNKFDKAIYVISESSAKLKEKEALRLERERELEDKLQKEETIKNEVVKAKSTLQGPKQVGKIDLGTPEKPAAKKEES